MEEKIQWSLPSPSRSPWQLLYRSAHRRRWRYWQERAIRLPKPVISVGNLHWGGTGKTPVVAALAEFLKGEGFEVCVLSKGYGRTTRQPLIVSEGDGPRRGPHETGDEPWLLAQRLDGVSVVVARKRVDAGRLALERLPRVPDLFILDDGFSHLRLDRDIDIVVLPDDDPFGGGLLLPGGRLREPLESIERAQVMVLSGRRARTRDAERIGNHLKSWGFTGKAYATPTRVGSIRGPEELSPDRAVLLVSGIARPRRFERAVAEKKIRFRDHLIFSDHHRYPQKSLDLIEKRVRQEDLQVLTTEKDFVKLRNRLNPEPHVLSIYSELPESLKAWLVGHPCFAAS